MCRSKRKPISMQPSKLISASNINSQNDTNLIKIRVANHSALPMVDSGAQVSAISADYFHANLQNKYSLEKAFLIVNGVSGALLKVKVKINITIEIGRLSLQQTVYVIHDLKHSFILGLDFLTKQKASLNLQSGITEVPIGKNNDSSICFISLIKDENIPARSEVLVPIQTVNKNIRHKIGLI